MLPLLASTTVQTVVLLKSKKQDWPLIDTQCLKLSAIVYFAGLFLARSLNLLATSKKKTLEKVFKCHCSFSCYLALSYIFASLAIQQKEL